MEVSATTQSHRRPYVDLFLVSFLILFFELAAIRWFAATVVFLTFFTNIVLLACFLGMSVGLLTASRPVNLVRTVLPLAMVSFAAAVATNLLYWQWADAVTIGLGNQQASPQLVYFGTEYRPADPSRWVVPMWAVAGTFFTLIALTFIGLGQVMGRAFTAIPDREHLLDRFRPVFERLMHQNPLIRHFDDTGDTRPSLRSVRGATG